MTNNQAPQDDARVEQCPFCGNALTLRGGVNPYGRCGTEGCWMERRAITVPLDDRRQVAQWNTRSAQASAVGMREALVKIAAFVPTPIYGDWADKLDRAGYNRAGEYAAEIAEAALANAQPGEAG